MIRVALLMGINVGGAGRLPMAEFRAMLAGLGLEAVQTYIQSGNAVFRSDLPDAVLAPMIQGAVAARFGFAPAVFLRTADQMAAALDNPYAAEPGNMVHAFFLAEPAPEVNRAVLDRWIAPSERWHLGDGVFYLHHPDGIGRSKLAAKLDKVIGCAMTARNLNTVAALVAMTRTVS